LTEVASQRAEDILLLIIVLALLHCRRTGGSE